MIVGISLPLSKAKDGTTMDGGKGKTFLFHRKPFVSFARAGLEDAPGNTDASGVVHLSQLRVWCLEG